MIRIPASGFPRAPQTPTVLGLAYGSGEFRALATEAFNALFFAADAEATGELTIDIRGRRKCRGEDQGGG